VHVKYLDLDLLGTPSLALDRARLEMLHLGNRVREMLERILPAVVGGTRDGLEAIGKMDDKVDDLHGKIVTYLGKTSTVELNDRQTEELIRLLETVNDLENIGDVIETNLVSVGQSRIDKALVISSGTRKVIEAFHAKITHGFDAALMAVSQKNEEAAWRVIELKAEIDRLEDDAAVHRAQRLVAEEPNRLAAYTIETDILANLKRVYTFSERMARSAVR
jgi:phosphate:Na+ symporter